MSAACQNCGAALTGAYCAGCGQRDDPLARTVPRFLRDATEGLTHADSRLWRTLLPLLFRPGLLTREFLDGRRARYLPPFRLYLVISIAFFVIAALLPGERTVFTIDSDRPEATASHETPMQRAERRCGGIRYFGPWQAQIQQRLTSGCRKSLLDGGVALRAAFMRNTPRAMFVFLPVIAAFMLLIYRHPRRYYVEHLVLLLHNHAFVFLALGLMLPLQAAWPASLEGAASFLGGALALYMLYYFYRSLRRVYAQSRLRTVGKMLALGFVYLVLGAITLVFTAIYSAATI